LDPSGAKEKILLAWIYCAQFAPERYSRESFAQSLFITLDELDETLADLEKRGLVKTDRAVPELSASGRKAITVVMTGGAFDIIHPGHIETLEQARALGDTLIVSVARDSTFERNKKRSPQHNEVLRRDLVAAVKPVDCAILGSETDIFETVELLKPDIIALGYDQFHDEAKISEEVRKRGLDVKVVRLKASNPDIKTSMLIGAGSRGNF